MFAESTIPDTIVDEVLHPSIFRPVQYLGSKLRALPQISRAIESIQPRVATALDLFAGSSVVSQAIARLGYDVVATDALGFSAVICRAVLGVGRVGNRTHLELLSLLDEPLDSVAVPKQFQEFLSQEACALKLKDGDALLHLGATIPQVWRTAGADSELLGRFSAHWGRPSTLAFDLADLMATHYAGTYFGLRQALSLDHLRCKIAHLRDKGTITPWEQDALLCALLSAASACAFTPGKHFAQPHKIRDGKDKAFARQRVIQDRSLSITALFTEALERVFASASSITSHNAAYQMSLEALMLSPELLGRIGVVYADPPYTAQQYSRFYHVPEILVSYCTPELQVVSGQVTSGLYPVDRFKSRFSSKRQAPAAFADLFSFCKKLDAPLLISYSATGSGDTGNDRMIQLEPLLHMAELTFTAHRVQVIELEHEYRQFNSKLAAVAERNDKEYLVVCDPRC